MAFSWKKGRFCYFRLGHGRTIKAQGLGFRYATVAELGQHLGNRAGCRPFPPKISGAFLPGRRLAHGPGVLMNDPKGPWKKNTEKTLISCVAKPTSFEIRMRVQVSKPIPKP